MPVVIYNPRLEEKAVPIRDFTWKVPGVEGNKWSLGVNKLQKFPDEVGEALLKTYGFLIRVIPENVADIRDRMKDKKFKCPYCPFRTDVEIALKGHKRKHKITPEDEAWMQEQVGDYDLVKKTETKTEEVAQKEIEQKEGITAKNDFYGPGLEEDNLTDVKVNIPGKTPGVF